MPADLVISNATIIDGTGAPGRRGDLAVEGQRIASVGAVAASERAHATVFDGTGLVVAPGFIDVHTHDDWAVRLDPDHACKTLQGVTTVVTGNCGISPAPATEGGSATYASMGDYLDELGREPVAVNVAALVGHGSIREAVIGRGVARAATGADVTNMTAHLEAALDAGCVGMSSGLAYEPGCFAAPDELVSLARVVADAGGIYTSHMRDESAGLLDSIDETIAVGAACGVRVQISHLKAAQREHWGTVREALARIDAANEAGVDVMADQYPYTRGSTVLEQVVRSGALDGPSPFGHLTGDQILVAAAPNRPDWEGATVNELAAAAGVDARVMADRIVDEAGRGCMVVLDIMSEDDVRMVLAHPRVMIGSDGVPAGSKPHPRLHHTYPRVLGEYVRRLGILELPEAVHRMTAMPAARFGLEDRGVLRPGAFADLVLFDPATIVDTGTYTDPTTVPIGISRVLVNGRTVALDGASTGARPGAVLRRQ